MVRTRFSCARSGTDTPGKCWATAYPTTSAPRWSPTPSTPLWPSVAAAVVARSCIPTAAGRAHLTAKSCFRHGLRRSIGATGICWDNSPAESFWSTFKHEHYYRHVYATRAEFVAAIDNGMSWYSNQRRHSAIGMLNPVHYEQSLT